MSSAVNLQNSLNQDVAGGDWMQGATFTSKPPSSRSTGEDDPNLRHVRALTSHVSTQHLRTPSFPSTESSRQIPGLHDAGVVSESATVHLANITSTSVTPSPRGARLSQTPPASTTPTRNARRPAMTPQQPGPIISSPLSPQRATTTSDRKRAPHGGYSFPCLPALRKFFDENDVKEYRCIAKQTSGQCKNSITDVAILREAKSILSKPCADIMPDEYRNVIRSLMCTTANHSKQKEKIESQWISRSAKVLSDTGSLCFAEPSPSQREIDPQDLPGYGIRSLAFDSWQEHSPNAENDGFPFCEQPRGSSAALGLADAHSRINDIPNEDTPRTRQVSAEMDGSTLSDLERISSESPSASRSSRESADLMVSNEETPSKRGLFKLGQGYDWPPEKIRHEVTKLFNASLPTQKTSGSLYLVKAKYSGHVKIGYTLGNLQERKSDIEAKSGVYLDNRVSFEITGLSFAVLLRLEKLVHTDLSHYQRDLQLKKKTRAQHEWFEIEFQQAVNTAQFWLEKISTPGATLREDFQITERNQELWENDELHSFHLDHEWRRQTWQAAMELPPKPTIRENFEQTWREHGRLWFAGCIVIFLASMVEPSMAMSVSGLLIALWTMCAQWISEKKSR
ncbi:hypothetical protein MBLNU13_g08714t1 [Cladosporium sp. NU13]